jgi:hypothetical protein
VIKGSKQETVIYCGDRWANFAGNGLGFNQWCPISFDGDVPHFNSLSSWNLNVKSGEWTVGKLNNYVKNGSFEADRKRIPSIIKPVQEQLTGWKTEILKGNQISLDSIHSPALNYFNTESDRNTVIGEKSLHISDKVNFKRKISQLIKSSPYVKLENGKYTLTAKVKKSSGFKSFEMYAASQGKTLLYPVEDTNYAWQTISIANISVKNGIIELGFIAEGSAFATAEVDDVILVKMN